MRVVDEDVDGAEGLNRRLHGLEDVRLLTDVAPEGQAVAPSRSDGVHRCLDLCVRAPGGHDAGAFAGEGQGDPTPDTLSSAGDDRHLAVEQSHRPLSLIAIRQSLRAQTLLTARPGRRGSAESVAGLRGGLRRDEEDGVAAVGAEGQHLRAVGPDLARREVDHRQHEAAEELIA